VPLPPARTVPRGLKLSRRQSETSRLQALLAQGAQEQPEGAGAGAGEAHALRAHLERRREKLRAASAMLRSKAEEERRTAQQARSKTRRLAAAAAALLAEAERQRAGGARLALALAAVCGADTADAAASDGRGSSRPVPSSEESAPEDAASEGGDGARAGPPWPLRFARAARVLARAALSEELGLALALPKLETEEALGRNGDAGGEAAALVLAVDPGGPAAAQLRAGDRVVAIGGAALRGMAPAEAELRLRCAPGAALELERLPRGGTDAGPLGSLAAGSQPAHGQAASGPDGPASHRGGSSRVTVLLARPGGRDAPGAAASSPVGAAALDPQLGGWPFAGAPGGEPLAGAAPSPISHELSRADARAPYSPLGASLGASVEPLTEVPEEVVRRLERAARELAALDTRWATLAAGQPEAGASRGLDAVGEGSCGATTARDGTSGADFARAGAALPGVQERGREEALDDTLEDGALIVSVSSDWTELDL
jgi:hypothetical protein